MLAGSAASSTSIPLAAMLSCVRRMRSRYSLVSNGSVGMSPSAFLARCALIERGFRRLATRAPTAAEAVTNTEKSNVNVRAGVRGRAPAAPPPSTGRFTMRLSTTATRTVFLAATAAAITLLSDGTMTLADEWDAAKAQAQCANFTTYGMADDG